MQANNYTGIVLKSKNYKESDRIYTILTLEKGKLSVRARGVRKITSKRSGNLDTLNLVKIKLSENSNNFRYIEEARTINTFAKIKKDYQSLLIAYYFVELTMKTLEDEQEAPEIFKLLTVALNYLNDRTVETPIIRLFFEVNLMNYLGYPLQTENCVKCREPFTSDQEFYQYNFGLGGFYCHNCAQGRYGIEKSSFIGFLKIVNGNIGKNIVIPELFRLSEAMTSFIQEHTSLKLKSLELLET
jgi:DNA repair protein RecO (recombination protein O)